MRLSLPARAARLRFASLAAFAILACKGGDTGPRTPTAIEASTTTTFTATVASTVSPAPTVIVKDAGGRGVSGVLVRWRVVAGGGHVANDTVRTNTSGTASPGTWTLGNGAGTQELEANADGVGSIRFTAQAAAGPINKLIRVSADAQPGVVGQPVQVLPSVRAEDAFGNPLSGVTVSFSVVTGGGTVQGGSKTTNAQGIATVDGWILGPTRGQQLLRASSGGILANFAVTAAPGAPAVMETVSGTALEGLSGVAINPVPVVRVLDEFGNPVGGVTVQFTPGENSGSVTGGIQMTNATFGTASPSSWTLGESEVSTLNATVVSNPEVGVSITATAVLTLFKVELRWVGSPPGSVVQAVQRAINRWRSVIVGKPGISQVNMSAAAASSCREFLPPVNEVVDGILLYAMIGPIDGSSNTLANAGFCINARHPETGLPAVGTILIDEADLQSMVNSGRIDNVIAHEMGHSFGFSGGFFNLRGLINGQGTSDPYFTGTKARSAFLEVGGGSYGGNHVPLENQGGAGTTSSHWRKSVFDCELLVGFICSGAMPLSRVTAGLMEDIGYVVRHDNAEAYSIFSGFQGLDTVLPVPLHNDVIPPRGAGGTVRTVKSVKEMNERVRQR